MGVEISSLMINITLTSIRDIKIGENHRPEACAPGHALAP